jgi:hypothetical protein
VEWHFLTVGVGDANYERAAKRLSREAQHSQYFSSVISETNATLKLHHKLFLDEHGKFISENENLGYGNFLWKSYLVKYWLNKIPAGDGLLYLDSGCSFNFKTQEAKVKFENYLETAYKKGSLLTQLTSGQFGIDDLSEKSWSTPELIELMKLSAESKNSNQIQAGVLFLINNLKNREIVGNWWETCIVDDYYYLRHSNFKNHKNILCQNRHDQSIFSCLAKKNNMHAISDETYFYPDWYKFGKYYPIWAMRNRSGISRNAPYVKHVPARLLNFAIKIQNLLLRYSND